MTQNTVAAQAGRKPQKKSQSSGMSRALVRRETISAYLFLLPSLVFFVTFVVVLMSICPFYSFTEYGLGGVKGFAGLENYIKLFQDPVFHWGLLSTLPVVVVAVPCVTAFSLWVSSAIYKMYSISHSFFRCVFYLPVVTGSVAIAVVWKRILNPCNGILSQVAGTTGFDWLDNPETTIWFMTLILFTASIGQPIVLYVAALGDVDQSLIEAARVDGVTKLQVFWKIKWLQIMPTTLYVLVITTIDSFQCLALIQLLTKGGPLNSTTTIMYQVYDTAYRLYDLGYACAIGVVLVIIIAIFSIIQFKVAKTDWGGSEKMSASTTPVKVKKTDLSGTSTAYKVFVVVILTMLAVFPLLPLYWIVTGSFKNAIDINAKVPVWFPMNPTMGNYDKLFAKLAFLWLFNIVFIFTMAMILTCITAALTGYALGKKRLYGRTILFIVIICAMALPKQVIIIPLAQEMKLLHMSDALWTVILPMVDWSFGVFLMKQFSETIPNEILEAARVDGVGELKTFFSVVFPMIKPGIGVLTIFAFVNIWNDYFLQLVMLTSEGKWTLPLAITNMQGEMFSDFGLIMAGAALVSIPIIVMFTAFQKYLTQGITMGAVRG